MTVWIHAFEAGMPARARARAREDSEQLGAIKLVMHQRHRCRPECGAHLLLRHSSGGCPTWQRPLLRPSLCPLRAWRLSPCLPWERSSPSLNRVRQRRASSLEKANGQESNQAQPEQSVSSSTATLRLALLHHILFASHLHATQRASSEEAHARSACC